MAGRSNDEPDKPMSTFEEAHPGEARELTVAKEAEVVYLEAC